MKNCGCSCVCHNEEDYEDWPGPCAGCCEPGDMCVCGQELARLGMVRSIMPTEFTIYNNIYEAIGFAVKNFPDAIIYVHKSDCPNRGRPRKNCRCHPLILEAKDEINNDQGITG